MKNLFVPIEIALTLKEKGFNEPCLAYFAAENNEEGYVFEIDSKHALSLSENTDSHLLAPLYQQVIDWLDIKHGIFIAIHKEFRPPFQYGFVVNKMIFAGIPNKMETSREALNKAIIESLKLI